MSVTYVRAASGLLFTSEDYATFVANGPPACVASYREKAIGPFIAVIVVSAVVIAASIAVLVYASFFRAPPSIEVSVRAYIAAETASTQKRLSIEEELRAAAAEEEEMRLIMAGGGDSSPTTDDGSEWDEEADEEEDEESAYDDDEEDEEEDEDEVRAIAKALGGQRSSAPYG